jgi:fumarate reductase (CoM/CoB) subunit A
VLTEEAVQEARTLESLGAAVLWEVPPKPLEPQIRYPRSLFIPGREILATLKQHLNKQKNVLLLEDHLAIELLTDNSQVIGSIFFNFREGNLVVCESKATVLATGSMGEVYPLSAHEPMGIPTGSTGSGYVMAGLAGADLVDMEMIQFTIMPINPPLIRGLRCLPWMPILNANGREFLPPDLGAYSYEAAQLIWEELAEDRGPVYMDLRGKEPLVRRRHPASQRRSACLKGFGVTPYQRPIEIGLGVLSMMGGVCINERCETSVSGLYAAGEVTANVHGAKRVPGNAFTEMVVFGARAGRSAAGRVEKMKSTPAADKNQIEGIQDYLSTLFRPGNGDITPKEIRQEVKSSMGKYAHMGRQEEGLNKALKELETVKKNLDHIRIKASNSLKFDQGIMDGIDLRWLVNCAEIICQAALLRQESRGFHFRKDFPEEKNEWLKHTVVSRKKIDEIGWKTSVKPISQ